MGEFTTVSLTCPVTSAEAGVQFAVTARATNKYASNQLFIWTYAYAEGQTTGNRTELISKADYIAPNGNKPYVSGAYTMPNEHVSIVAWTKVYDPWGGGWREVDDTDSCTVSLGGGEGWHKVAEMEFTVIPVPGGWHKVAEMEFTVAPGVPGGWHKVAEMEFIVMPKGTPPCTVDSHCPEGYECKDGVCVKKEEDDFPWGWVLIGGAAVAGVALLATKKKKPLDKKGKQT